jgi:hypothetical protein
VISQCVFGRLVLEVLKGCSAFTFSARRLDSPQCRWEKGKPVRVTGIRRSGTTLCCISSCIFLVSIRCYYGVICHVHGTCGQRPSCVWRSLLWFPYLIPLPARSCCGFRNQSRRPWRNVATRPTTKHYTPECLYHDHSSKICLTSVFVGNLARILTKLPTILVRWYFSQANVRNSTLKLSKYCPIPLFLLPDLSVSVNFNTSRSWDSLNIFIGERLEIFRVLLRISQSASFGYELLDL